MTAIEAPGLLTFTIAIVVFFAGAWLNRLIPPLRRWNIPEAVTGGLLAAVLTLIAYVGLGIEIGFSLDARDQFMSQEDFDKFTLSIVAVSLVSFIGFLITLFSIRKNRIISWDLKRKDC